LTRDFQKYHYVLVEDIIRSFSEPEELFGVVRLVTLSKEYNNVKIPVNIYDEKSTSLDLKKSYITRDIFLISTRNIQPGKIYGKIDLFKLRDVLEY
jgi:hypothetical protein